ncbi:MAG: N-acetylneuraminate synthase family protein [Candidatus Omnitrophica bacterium]|nr:N-acetylneuraminate synthase family protein [Candidatus Omnitrophota bacterium]MDD5429923.1 N-acetylneuraminate synthase family protein [Candidatus Omnitrophota bacterium]
MKANNAKSSYIIAETAYNHQGDIKYLYRMVDEIAEIGLDAVKFHLLLNPASYLQKEHPLRGKIESWIFSEGQWLKLLRYSKEKRLSIIALCDDVESLDMINEKNTGVDAVEIHASALNDYFLLKEAARFKGTVMLGIGGSSLDEIQYAVNFLKENGKTEIILMHGFQNYPTNYREINLFKMLKIKELFNLPVGFADHTDHSDVNNEFISSLAGACGVNILEKHYTLDFGKERLDYHSAVGKKQIKKIRELMDLALAVYGDGNLEMSKSEQEYGKTGPMKKAIVAKEDIKKGEKFSLDNLCFKRTQEESGLRQKDFLKLIGKKAATDIKQDEVIEFHKVYSDCLGENRKDLTGGVK